MQSIMNKERTITKTQANHIAKLHNEIQECTNKQHETNDATHMMQPNDTMKCKNFKQFSYMKQMMRTE